MKNRKHDQFIPDAATLARVMERALFLTTTGAERAILVRGSWVPVNFGGVGVPSEAASEPGNSLCPWREPFLNGIEIA